MKGQLNLVKQWLAPYEQVQYVVVYTAKCHSSFTKHQFAQDQWFSMGPWASKTFYERGNADYLVYTEHLNSPSQTLQSHVMGNKSQL